MPNQEGDYGLAEYLVSEGKISPGEITDEMIRGGLTSEEVDVLREEVMAAKMEQQMVRRSYAVAMNDLAAARAQVVERQSELSLIKERIAQAMSRVQLAVEIRDSLSWKRSRH